MAATVTEIGTSSTASNVVSRSLTVGGGGIPQGAVVDILLIISVNGATHSCADNRSGSNVYTQEVSTAMHSRDGRLVRFRCELAVALQAGDVITVSWDTSTSAGIQGVYYGGLSSSAFDQSNFHGDQAATTTPDTGTTGTLAQAAELIVVSYGYEDAPSFTSPAGFSQTGLTAAINCDPTWISASMAWMEVAATTALNPTCTLGASKKSSGAILAYKIEGAPVGQVVTPFTFGIVVAGTVSGEGQPGGSLVSPFNFGRVVSGKVSAKSRVDSPFTFGISAAYFDPAGDNTLHVTDADEVVQIQRSVNLGSGVQGQVAALSEAPEVVPDLTGATVQLIAVTSTAVVSLDVPHISARVCFVRAWENSLSQTTRMFYRRDGADPTNAGANCEGYLMHGEGRVVRLPALSNFRMIAESGSAWHISCEYSDS